MIISFQSVPIFCRHNTKFLYPAGGISIITRIFEWFLLYSICSSVSSIYLFFLIGRLYFTVGKSFSHPNYPKSRTFSTCDGVWGVHPCKQCSHAVFLSCDVLICEVSFLLCLPCTVSLQYVFSSFQNSSFAFYSYLWVFVFPVLLRL